MNLRFVTAFFRLHGLLKIKHFNRTGKYSQRLKKFEKLGFYEVHENILQVNDWFLLFKDQGLWILHKLIKEALKVLLMFVEIPMVGTHVCWNCRISVTTVAQMKSQKLPSGCSWQQKVSRTSSDDSLWNHYMVQDLIVSRSNIHWSQNKSCSLLNWQKFTGNLISC